MNNEFILLLAEHGEKLSGYFRYVPQGQYNSYELLFKAIVDQILNAKDLIWNSDEITYLSQGGTKEDRILIIPSIKGELLVSDYLITKAYYAPLFGVDADEQTALDLICNGRTDVPASGEQSRRYMKHVWELVLNIRRLG